MSWQSYVDTNLVGTGSVTKAAIVGHDGGSWAASAGFSIGADEAKALVAAFSSPDAVRANGLNLSGVKYLCIKADDRSVYAKKNATGVCCVKTGQAVLIALYDEKIQPGQCANVVEKLADYLIGQNF